MGAPWRPRGPDDLDEEQRARIRRRVLGSVRPLRRTLADRVTDRAYDAFALLAIPAPHLVRAIVAGAVIVSIVGTATVASADALPNDPLYTVKVAGEQLRLTLARTPEDRASVELSMAEHRHVEAVRLVEDGRPADAIVVTSAYGTHLANAAAELATVERLNVASRPVVEQLKQRLWEQQAQAADMAARFVSDPATNVGAQLFRTIASFAPAQGRDETVSVGIADHAAAVADQLAAVAQRLADRAAVAVENDDSDDEDDDATDERHRAAAPVAADAPAAAPQASARAPADVPSRATARPTEAPRAASGQRTDPRGPTAAIGATGPDAARPAATAKAAATAKPTKSPKASVDPKKSADAQAAKAAAEKAKREAVRAHLAAEKAKEAAKKTATPKPAPKR